MKKWNRNKLRLLCLSLSLVAGTAGGVLLINNQTASANENTLAMEKGASLYLNPTGDITTGLKFSFTDSAYDVNAEYGMMIVANDMLEDAQAALTDGDITGVETDDYVNLIKAAKEADIFNEKDVPIFATVAQGDDGLLSHSVGELNEYNYVREFFGIGYKVTGENTYQYATLNDNVRSVFEVANLALNCHVYDGGEYDGEAGLSQEEQDEYNKISGSKEAIEYFVTDGFAFVYGDVTPTASLEATYIGGEITPEVSLTPLTGKENVQPNIHWNYAMAENSAVAQMTAEGKLQGVTRGQGTLNAGIGGVMEVPATVSVLKDTTELQIYNDSKDANFFAIDDTSFAGKMVADGTAYSTVKLDGGYWNGAGTSDGYKNPGYFVIENPDATDGKYTLNTAGLLLDFYFTGNNMPNVEFFATSKENIDFGKSGGGTTGYMVTNGIARSDSYYEYVKTVKASYDSDAGTYDTSGWQVNDNYRYNGIVGSPWFFGYGVSKKGGFNRANYNNSYDSYFASSYALDDTNKSSGYNIITNPKGSNNTWSTGAVGYGTKLSQFELMKDETKNWHYQVCLYLSSSKPRWSARIYEVAEDGTETLYHSKANKLVVNTNSTASGYVVVHGALKGSKTACNDAGNGNYYYTELAYKKPSKSKFTS